MTTKESPQGDGTHLHAGSIQVRLNEQNRVIIDLRAKISGRDERIRAHPSA